MPDTLGSIADAFRACAEYDESRKTVGSRLLLFSVEVLFWRLYWIHVNPVKDN